MLDEVSNECLVSSLTPLIFSAGVTDDLHLSCSSIFYLVSSFKINSKSFSLFNNSHFKQRSLESSLFKVSLNQYFLKSSHPYLTQTENRKFTFILNQPIDTPNSTINLTKLNDLHTKIYGRIDFNNLTMNNVTTISSLFTRIFSFESLNVTNVTNDDFLIINLSADLNKPDYVQFDLESDQQINQNSTQLNYISKLYNSSFNSEFNYTNNRTLDQDKPIITIHHPWLALFLACICMFIVLGNLLVIVAVRKSRQLRQQTTNYFVMSLAFSDCIVGLIVMPFSVVQEVMNGVWIFGPAICDLWHSFDVWGTTSSILSLCVISIDRYYAITKPFDYAVKMTSKKAKLLIVLIFTVSSLLSFPAIFWWRAISIYKPFECTFPVSTGYIVFSSTLSFYGPLVVMVIAYYKIYRAAVEQTRSLKTGAKTISYTSNIYHAGSGHFDNGQFNKSTATKEYPDQMITLRMHRGGNYNDSISSKLNTNLKIETNKKNQKQKKPFTLATSKGRSSTSLDRLASVFCNMRNEPADNMTSGRGSKRTSSSELNLNEENNSSIKTNECEDEKKDSFDQSQVTCGSKHQVNNAWSISRKVSKLAKERKAAKTLGIVMGVFIACWAPFFITHIVMGICASACDINEDRVYSIVTWLGWLNSAMNPIIYVLWSRDFRKAFRKVLCGFRDSSQRSSTGYSSYYFSNKCNNAPASSLARKRPLIGDRHFSNRQTNKLSLKQFTQQSKERTIETINELDDDYGEQAKPMKKIIQNANRPIESKSSPNLMDLSNVTRKSDSNDNLTNTLQTILPSKELDQRQKSNSIVIEQFSDQTKQLKQICDNQKSNLNGQTLSDFKEQTKFVKERDIVKRAVQNGQLKEIAENKKKTTELKDKLNSLGNWFLRSKDSEKENRTILKRSNKKANNENGLERKVEKNYAQNNQKHVDKIRYKSDSEFDKNDKNQIRTKIIETNQAEDNNLSSIDQKMETTSVCFSINNNIENTDSIDNHQVIKHVIEHYNQTTHHDRHQDRQRNNMVHENVTDIEQFIVAHEQSIKGNKKEDKLEESLSSPYCNYKITAECVDKLTDDKEEEFTIKIQLTDPRS